MIPLIPSPGRPKMTSTSQSSSASMSASAAVRATETSADDRSGMLNFEDGSRFRVKAEQRRRGKVSAGSAPLGRPVPPLKGAGRLWRATPGRLAHVPLTCAALGLEHALPVLTGDANE